LNDADDHRHATVRSRTDESALGSPAANEGSKARRFGCHDLVDTEEMFLRMFSDFRRERIIP